MKCINCGMELNLDDKVCPSCHISISDAKNINITYEDEEEIVDEPVIIESHTFIDEESFAKKVNEAKKEQEEAKSFANVYKVLFGVFVFIIIGFVFTFVVLPNISTNKKTNILEDNNFTTEDWKSGEFILENEFYRINESFSKYFNKGWSFESDIYNVNSKLSSHEETDVIELDNSFNKKLNISVSLINKTSNIIKIKDSLVNDVLVDNTKGEVIDFTLPGQITVGSKELEIESIYGKLDDAFITRDEVSMSTTYHYNYLDHKYLDLIVYDNGGLKAFHYSFK